MPPNSSVQQMSNLFVLLRAGGLPLAALGVLLTIAGLFIVLRPQRRTVVAWYAAISLLPGALAVMLVYAACTDFTTMAASAEPPKPSEFAAAVGRAMSFSFFGLISVLVPETLAIIAFLRVPTSDSSGSGGPFANDYQAM